MTSDLIAEVERLAEGLKNVLLMLHARPATQTVRPQGSQPVGAAVSPDTVADHLGPEANRRRGPDPTQFWTPATGTLTSGVGRFSAKTQVVRSPERSSKAPCHRQEAGRVDTGDRAGTDSRSDPIRSASLKHDGFGGQFLGQPIQGMVACVVG